MLSAYKFVVNEIRSKAFNRNKIHLHEKYRSLLLFILFYIFGKLNTMGSNDKTEAEPALAKIADTPATSAGADDEVMAAICFALYQHLNAHDQESGVLTFRRDNNTAWSAKSSLMRALPERR